MVTRVARVSIFVLLSGCGSTQVPPPGEPLEIAYLGCDVVPGGCAVPADSSGVQVWVDAGIERARALSAHMSSQLPHESV